MTITMTILIIISGLPGVGKSFFGDKLAGKLTEKLEELDLDSGIKILRTDEIRKELAGISREDHRYEKFGGGIYTKGMSERTYEEMFKRVRGLLESGRSCILDATFSKEKHRAKAAEIARETGVPFLVVECVCPEDVVLDWMKKRLEDDKAVSDATIEIYYKMRETFEPIREPHIVVDTSKSLDENLEKVLEEIHKGIERNC